MPAKKPTAASKKEIIPLPGKHYARVTYSPAVKVGNLLFISGQGGIDPETDELVGRHDLVAQVRKAYQNIRAIVEKAGGTMDNIVKTVDYVAPEALPFYRETAAVRREFFKNGFPASTGVVVHRLLLRDMLIEIDAIAVLD